MKTGLKALNGRTVAQLSGLAMASTLERNATL